MGHIFEASWSINYILGRSWEGYTDIHVYCIPYVQRLPAGSCKDCCSGRSVASVGLSDSNWILAGNSCYIELQP